MRGKKGFNTFGNLQEYLRIGKEVYSGSVHLDNQECRVLEITKDLTCVLACMDVYTPPEEGPVFTEHIHITIIYRREGSEWKILHVHNSFADGIYGETTTAADSRHWRDFMMIKEEATRMAAKEVEEVRKLDTLTGIYNMEGFAECLEDILQKNPSKHYVILKFGINQFRYINHVLGLPDRGLYT